MKRAKTLDVPLLRIPKVGDKLMRVATCGNFGCDDNSPKPCIVVYVNEPHSYYIVEFIDMGFRESYKHPDIDEIRCFRR